MIYEFTDKNGRLIKVVILPYKEEGQPEGTRVCLTINRANQNRAIISVTMDLAGKEAEALSEQLSPSTREALREEAHSEADTRTS